MKKFFVMFAIAGALVSCNNSGESTTATDTPATTEPAVVTPVDSPVVVTPVDSANLHVDSTHKADTTKK